MIALYFNIKEFQNGTPTSLPAVFILSSCCTFPDATRVIDPATPQSSDGVPVRREWWRSVVSPLIGSLASCRHLH
jgi:hypothetical protein